MRGATGPRTQRDKGGRRAAAMYQTAGGVPIVGSRWLWFDEREHPGATQAIPVAWGDGSNRGKIFSDMPRVVSFLQQRGIVSFRWRVSGRGPAGDHGHVGSRVSSPPHPAANPEDASRLYVCLPDTLPPSPSSLSRPGRPRRKQQRLICRLSTPALLISIFMEAASSLPQRASASTPTAKR